MQLATVKKKSLVNLTPLIDVVFILLIFFMLASNFSQWHQIELSVGEVEEIQVDQKEISTIKIDKNNAYLLNEKTLPLIEIISNINVQVLINSNHPVIIEVEQGASVQGLVDLLDHLRHITTNVSLIKSEN